MKPNSPRRRLVTVKGTQGSGAGGAVTITALVPFGRKWRLIHIDSSFDDNNVNVYYGISIAGTEQRRIQKHTNNTSGAHCIFGQGTLVAGNTMTEGGGKGEYWLKNGEQLQIYTAAMAASKTLTYAYCVEEYADDGHSASPT